jgi:carboxypeptidase C (cathepsin A)
MRKVTSLWASLALAGLLSLTVFGQQAPEKKDPEQNGINEHPPLEDAISETHHSVNIGGTPVNYLARAGTLVLRTEEGKPRATVFFVSYTREGADNPSQRPITFTFNGGPGSSSVWLHLGAFGPRRVVMDEEGFELPPPYQLTENQFSLLDVTDLVFIDPVTTGYSRSAPGEDPQAFHGVTEDIESVGEFIRLYTTRYKRWASPKFLAGESYGTTRAAGLSGYLQTRHGIYLNGIILVSSVLDFQTLLFDTGNDLPFILYLPSYAAAAWYHKQLAPDLQRDLEETLKKVEEFAANDYLLALWKGSQLKEAERNKIAERVAQYTGLDKEYVLQSNLRIKDTRFFKELLRKQGRTTGRLDSRFIGFDADSAGESIEFDPSMSAILGPYTATLNDYISRDLEFSSDLPYEILTDRVQPWKFGPAENRYLNVAETLRKAIANNQNLRVFVASGYYDLATPYFATEYTFDHLSLPEELLENISIAYYQAGHMMYIREASLEKLKKDIEKFIESAMTEGN